MAGEFDFIRWIRATQRNPSNVLVGPGDDLAVVDWNAADLLIVGVDQVLDGRHFDSKIHSPADIGRKAMNRNLSDCAAMACLPAVAVCTIALPRTQSIEYAKALFTGMSDAATAFDCPIVGGDTGSWDGPLVVTVTILGKSAGVSPVRRDRAQAGDKLYVTGPLGGSILGRHLTLIPRVELARQLATTYRITSMIDLSDGLTRDVRHLCEQSNVGVTIDAASIPVHSDVQKLPVGKLSPLDHALCDGEDYELLFTSPDNIPADLATQIGIMEGDQLLIRRDGKTVPLPTGGWEHAFLPLPKERE